VPEVYRLAKPNTAHIFFAGWSEAWVPQLLAQWFTVKACIVWVKNVWGIGYYTRPQHEFMWYCHKGSPPVPAKAGSDVWDFRKVVAPRHSREQPVAWLRRAARWVRQPGGVSRAPCPGPGTPGQAGGAAGRSDSGTEIAPGYCRMVRERMAVVQPPLPLVAGT